MNRAWSSLLNKSYREKERRDITSTCVCHLVLHCAWFLVIPNPTEKRTINVTSLMTPVHFADAPPAVPILFSPPDGLLPLPFTAVLNTPCFCRAG